MPRWIEETAEGVILRVHAQPKARKTELAGPHGESIKVRLAAPPTEGRANEALLRFLAEALGVARTRVRLVRGEAFRDKLLAVDGVSEVEAREKLESLLPT